MLSLYVWLKSWMESEEGQDFIEYALLVGLIVLAVVGAVVLAGNSVSQVFSNVASRLASVAS